MSEKEAVEAAGEPCSSSEGGRGEVLLDAPALLNVIRSVVNISPIAKVAQLTDVCSDWRSWTQRALRHCDDLRLEVPSGNKVGITVQGSYMRTTSQALECLEYMLSQISYLKRLSVHFYGPSLSALNDVLDYLISSDKVRLEVLRVTGRRWSLRVPRFSQLMVKCSSTLRNAGKIGMTEFEEARANCRALNLDRLSLTCADLLSDTRGFDMLTGEMRSSFSRICELHSECTITHLSVSTVSGFNPAIDPYNRFIRQALVVSLRVTIQTGGLIESNDVVSSRLLPLVCSLEMDQFPDNIHHPADICALFPYLHRMYINSPRCVSVHSLERAFSYASEWFTTFSNIKLEGVVAVEILPSDFDPPRMDRIRCLISGLHAVGAQLRVLSSESYPNRSPPQIVISNGAGSFQFTVLAKSCDLMMLTNLFDVDTPSRRCIALDDAVPTYF